MDSTAAVITNPSQTSTTRSHGSRRRGRRHRKTKRNQPNTISSQNQAKSAEHDLVDSDAVSNADQSITDSGGAVSQADNSIIDSGAVSDADEIDKGGYTPLSFYLDSAVNHPGPMRKCYLRGCPVIDKSVGKNSVPLSSYTTNLVYHPGESMMDIFLDPFGESKIDIFVDPNGEPMKDVFVNSMGESTSDGLMAMLMGIRMGPEMEIFRPLSFFIDPSVSYTGRKNYIRAPMDMGTIGDKSSQSKVTFCFPSSLSKIIFGSFGSKAESSKSKVSRNYIPEEIALSILLKLPVKSLKRFGCVCKSWSILLESTDFMTTYSNHFLSRHGSDDHYHTFILANQHYVNDENCYYYQPEFYLLENKLKLNLPSPLQRENICIVGSTSVNGIFCLGQTNFLREKGEQSRYVLWNPLTEEFMVIPSSPTELTPKPSAGLVASRGVLFHGFGYDQLRDDFKVIRYVSFFSDLSSRHTTSFFEIYSLKSNSWRMINMENHLSKWGYSSQCQAFVGMELYVDGACHWLVSESINHQHAMTLLSFDLSNEVFLTTPIGEEPCCPYTYRKRLTMLNGSIALVSNYHDDIVFHISILGELGVTESWIKLYTYGSFPSIQWSWPPIGFGKMGYIYVTKKDYEVAYVDLSTQIIEEVGITANDRSSKLIGGLYKESLLSIRGLSN